MEVEIKHFSHPHPLKHCPNKSKTPCSLCKQPIPPPTIYGCNSCNFYLHKSPCAQLPSKLHHPSHPPHPLTLSPPPHSTLSCNACWSHLENSFTFHCQPCRFDLDINCASRLPNIKLDAIHNHPFAFFKSMVYYEDCQICGKVVRDMALRCVPCNFNVHVYCVATLPETAKLRFHLHELKFKECLDEDDLDEFYCDACEQERTPNQCVYSCVEDDCSGFVAHISCAIDEPQIIQTILQGAKEKCASVGGDPFLFELDEEIATVRSEKQALRRKLEEMDINLQEATAKLEGLEEKRAQYLASSSSRSD